MKILFLQKRLLFPHNTGGKIRSLNVLRHLAKRHDVTYACNVQEDERQYLDQMKSLGVDVKSIPWIEAPRRSCRFILMALSNLVASHYPLNVDKDFDPKLRELVESEVRAGGYDLLICDFVQSARNCLGIEIPKLLFQHNVEAEIFERMANRRSGPFAWYLSLQARRMRSFESEAGFDFDGVVAVSQRDKQRFETSYGWRHVSVIDTAVDMEFFQGAESATERCGVVFVGSMDWAPNVDGVEHFVRSVWPTVHSIHANVEFTIVGRNPPQAISRMHGQQGVRVTGTVDDIRPYLANAAVAIVPLYSGGGTRLKIFEYMAMNCPVVSTTLGAEGLDVQNDEHLLIRDNDDDIAQAIVDLINDQRKRERLASRAHEFVRSRYSAQRIAGQFERHCESAVERRHRLTPS